MIIQPDGVAVADPTNTLSILSPNGPNEISILALLVVILAVGYVFFTVKGKRRNTFIFLIVALYIAGSAAGLLSTTTDHPVWKDNDIDCTGMSSNEQYQAAAHQCAYAGVKEGSVVCQPAREYFRFGGTTIFSPSGGVCGATESCSGSVDGVARQCSQPNDVKVSQGIAGYCRQTDYNKNQCQCGTMISGGNTFISVGQKRLLTWTCKDSGDVGGCSTKADCDKDAEQFLWTSYKCSVEEANVQFPSGMCVASSTLFKLVSSHCSSYTDCYGQTQAYCANSGKKVKYAVCVAPAGASNCPACQSNAAAQLPIGCNGYCSYAYYTCPTIACSSTETCVNGVCIPKSVITPPNDDNPTGPECTTNADCQDGFSCRYNHCITNAINPSPSPSPEKPYCGDGICNNGEVCSTCSDDCDVCPEPDPVTNETGSDASGVSKCGDGYCSLNFESTTSCPKDCSQSQGIALGLIIFGLFAIIVIFIIIAKIFKKGGKK